MAELRRYVSSDNEFSISLEGWEDSKDDYGIFVNCDEGRIEVGLKHFTDLPTAEKAFEDLVEWLKR